MRIRIPAAGALALVATTLAVLGASTASATPVFNLRMEAPAATPDPGTFYAIPSVTSAPRGTLNAEGTCVDGPGRVPLASGTPLGLITAAAAASNELSPLHVAEDGFGKRVCRVGEFRERDVPTATGFLIRYNHVGPNQATDLIPLERGSETLWVYADFGAAFDGPNTGDELVLQAPARTQPGVVGVSVQAIAFDGTVKPAPDGTVVTGGTSPVATVAGVAAVPVQEGRTSLLATGPGAAPVEIRSASLSLCVSSELAECPPVRGRRVVGTNDGDSLKGTKGEDRIRSRGGPDKVKVAGGGADVVNCGKGKDIVIADDDDRLRRCERVGGSAGNDGGGKGRKDARGK